MKIVTNESLVVRRRRQAAVLSLGGLAILAIGLFVNLRSAGGTDQRAVVLTYMALIVGAVVSWVGIVLSDRWTMPPRADEALAKGLKGAGRAYCLYNYVLPADHVLVAPWGLTVFTVFNCDGPVTVRGRRWRDARPLWRRLLSFGRRPVREPSRILALETGALAESLVANDAESALSDVPIEGVAVFSRPGLVLVADEPSVPAMRADDLRAWLRTKSKLPRIDPAVRRHLDQVLDALAEKRLGGA